MKVKVITENYVDDFENKINNFLRECNGTIIDIKYQDVIAPSTISMPMHCFSAMIFYTETT